VLFTDGEDLEGAQARARPAARRQGVRGRVGTKGGTIPLTDAQGGRSRKTDPQGQPVVSHLDAEALRELARRTHGRYFSADHPGGEIGALRAALGAVGRGTRQGRLGSRPIERFHWFAVVAWTLLVSSWLLPERAAGTFALSGARGRRKGKGNGNAGARAAALAIATGALLLFAPSVARAEHPLIAGNRLYAKGDFAGAVRVIRSRSQHPDDPAPLTNLGLRLSPEGLQGRRGSVRARKGEGPAPRGTRVLRQGRCAICQRGIASARSVPRRAREAPGRRGRAAQPMNSRLRKLQGKENPDEKQPPAAAEAGPGRRRWRGGRWNAAELKSRPGRLAAAGPDAAGRGERPHARRSRAPVDALANGERRARRAATGAGGEERKEKDW
jgi:hypothetical protein